MDTLHLKERAIALIKSEYTPTLLKHPDFPDFATDKSDAYYDKVFDYYAKLKMRNLEDQPTGFTLILERIYESITYYLEDDPDSTEESLAQAGALIARAMVQLRKVNAE